MKRQAYQRPELRDANDNIIQAGTYGKESALVNGDNTGVLDYINNNLEALRDNINGSRVYVKNKDALTTPGDISAMYIAEDTGKWYLWDGTKYIETDNARKIADEAIAARDAAKASQSAAKTSETNAKTSESNATASKSAAATSASAAKRSENNAKTSESNAAASKSAAATSASAASSSASAAANSAKAAATSETHAASSETNTASYLAQAKTIKDEVESALGKVTGAMKYAGSVNAYADLPTANRNPGDVYNVKTADASHNIKAGENVAWNGTDWDPLGGTVDLSPYATNASVAGTLVNVTYSNATLNFVKKDGSKVAATINNVAHATAADTATSATTAAKATADANGQNIPDTYVKKTDIANSVTTGTLKVTGTATAPTVDAGVEDDTIATTKHVSNVAVNTMRLTLDESGKIYATKTEAGVPYQIKRNTAYKVGDVLTSPSLPPGCVIVVTQAGATGSTEPDWSTINSNMGGVITDGTVTFYINDTLSKHSVGDIVYKPLIKVTEHEYLLPLDGQTIDGTTYKRLVDYLGTNVLPNLNGRYLRADTTPGKMVEAGLPNITGKFQKIYTYADQAGAQGAFSLDAYATVNGPYENANTNNGLVISVDASRSSAIYGSSTTVTPLTYTVRAYIAYA